MSDENADEDYMLWMDEDSDSMAELHSEHFWWIFYVTIPEQSGRKAAGAKVGVRLILSKNF